MLWELDCGILRKELCGLIGLDGMSENEKKFQSNTKEAGNGTGIVYRSSEISCQ